jgi:hypothetical protein
VEIRDTLAGDASPISPERAMEAFGYEPQYLWSENRRFPEHAAG